MRRKILVLSYAALIAAYIISDNVCHAAWWDDNATEEGTATPAKTSTIKRTVTMGGTASSEEAKRIAEEAARTSLKSKEWGIYLFARDGKKGEGVEMDALTFTDETVSSRNLEAKGYPTSNMGIFVADNGSFSWETMKTNPATKDKVFLRGEFKNNVMTGTIFMKPQKGQTTTLIFSTINPETAVSAAAATVAETTTVKKSKK
ncbi:MAG: hypothetical protein A2Z72_06815 [Omnitrophica bacterium RBG_13_46_9]|nr:MAG: hypothetical protein A2Z72_06815 [Omnitrophica bacterium RBG_13_46_9]